MVDIEEVLNNSDLIQWLLLAKTPSIRDITLRQLLGRPEGDADLKTIQQAMKATGPILEILSRQTEAGCWSGEDQERDGTGKTVIFNNCHSTMEVPSVCLDPPGC